MTDNELRELLRQELRAVLPELAEQLAKAGVKLAKRRQRRLVTQAEPATSEAKELALQTCPGLRPRRIKGR